MYRWDISCKCIQHCSIPTGPYKPFNKWIIFHLISFNCHAAFWVYILKQCWGCLEDVYLVVFLRCLCKRNGVEALDSLFMLFRPKRLVSGQGRITFHKWKKKVAVKYLRCKAGYIRVLLLVTVRVPKTWPINISHQEELKIWTFLFLFHQNLSILKEFINKNKNAICFCSWASFVQQPSHCKTFIGHITHQWKIYSI